MVGALADWFAVTALFRHPLGLPIPHTAIIPNRKDQIGRSLGEFVQGNFLTREVLAERLHGVHVGQRLGRWLAVPDARRAGGGRRRRRHEGRHRGARRPRRRGRPSAGWSSAGCARSTSPRCSPGPIDVSVEGGHHQRLLDAMLTGLGEFLDENRATLRGRLQQESPWWVPEPIDDRIFNKIFNGVQQLPRATSRATRTTRCGNRSSSASSPRRAAAHRPRDDRQGRGAEGRAAVAPRGRRPGSARCGDR